MLLTTQYHTIHCPCVQISRMQVIHVRHASELHRSDQLIFQNYGTLLVQVYESKRAEN